MKTSAFDAPARIVLVVRHEALCDEIRRALELAGHSVLLLATAEDELERGLGADAWIVDRDGGEALGLAAIAAGLAPERIVWIGSAPSAAAEASTAFAEARTGFGEPRTAFAEPRTAFAETRTAFAEGAASRAWFELGKPFALADLEETVDAVLDRTQTPARPHDDFVLRTVEPGMVRVLERAERLARLDVPVVLEGELGTGREALARAIHGWSRRAGEAMHALDPGLVGVAGSGAATEAIGARVEQARWGVLLVRDPADWPLGAQHALANALRAEQGRPRCLTVARDALALRADRGDLAVELQYRLDAAALRLPPLRERPLDQAALCRAAARRVARSLGRETPDVDPELIAALAREGFPGNRIGLESRLRAALIRSDRPEALLPDDLASTGCATREAAATLESLDLKTLERETIVRALAHWKGNRTRASESLGISVRTLRNKIRDYGLR